MRKRHSKLFSLFALLLAASVSPGNAQTVTQTTVLSSPLGAGFTIDGTPFYNSFSAFWPVGSVHTLSICWETDVYGNRPVPDCGGANSNPTTQYQFTGWTWSTGSNATPTIQVIADPSITRYTANYNTQYLFTLQVACSTGPCTTFPGNLTVNGALVQFAANGALSFWASPGSSQILQVSLLNPGWLFAGWQVGNNAVVSGPAFTETVNAPITVTAVFVPAKQVTLATNPPELDIYADRTLFATSIAGPPPPPVIGCIGTPGDTVGQYRQQCQTAAGTTWACNNPAGCSVQADWVPASTLQWGLGTSHTLGGPDWQFDSNGKRWSFGSWNDAGAQTHTYVVGNNLNPETITATYVPSAYPFFTTSPINLNLVVDGLILPPPYSYIWGVGSTHTVAAPTPQTDAQGNTWKFKSWDDLVTANPRTITIPAGADVNGYGFVGLFTQQAKLTVGSTLTGQVVTVNGSPCTTPCSLAFDLGSQVHVSTPASVPVTSSSRQDFLGWSTGGGAPVAGDWISALNAANTSITATYHLMNSLTATANPSGAATWSISPTSPDGFYDSQTQVTVAVAARPGYHFNSWSGDLSGSNPSGSLTMSVPHSVLAQFGSIPYIAPSGVSNAAGSATQTGVAPGSVASIFGVNLTTATAIGPASPLVQTLAGATVHIGASLLPLYFASPAQINLQIPPGLALGPQTITVSSPGMPDVNCNFTIVRDAPGLFPVVVDGQTYALVLHADGSLVTAAAPAQQGELLTAYGTGFGPTSIPRPEGIAVPPTPPYLISDPVSIQVGTIVFTPVSAFAAPGQVGLDIVQFQLDNTAPSGPAIPVYVTVNGVNSNTLPLPIQ